MEKIFLVISFYFQVKRTLCYLPGPRVICRADCQGIHCECKTVGTEAVNVKSELCLVYFFCMNNSRTEYFWNSIHFTQKIFPKKLCDYPVYLCIYVLFSNCVHVCSHCVQIVSTLCPHVFTGQSCAQLDKCCRFYRRCKTCIYMFSKYSKFYASTQIPAK